MRRVKVRATKGWRCKGAGGAKVRRCKGAAGGSSEAGMSFAVITPHGSADSRRSCLLAALRRIPRPNKCACYAPLQGTFQSHDQLQNAAESIPANLAEGFYRYTHPEIARFFGIALGSLGESLTRLGSARAQSLISNEEVT